MTDSLDSAQAMYQGEPASPDRLAQALAADAPGALGQAWAAHGALVRAVATRALGTGSPWIADVEQATFLLLWQRRERLASHSQIALWCHATATRIASEVRRSERRRARREEAAMDTAAHVQAEANPTPGLDPDTAAALDGAIQRLSPACRAAVVGVYLAGEERAHVAARLGITEVALRQRLSQGMARLRRMLRPAMASEASVLALLQAPPGSPGAAPPWMAEPARWRETAPERIGTLARSASGRPVLGLAAMAVALVAALAIAAALTLAWWPHPDASPAPRQAPAPHASAGMSAARARADHGDSGDDAIPPGPPTMLGAAQRAMPVGGRVVLWSRSRWGNYPLATYDFRLGLRGDHPDVHNRVQLAFGNRRRTGAWTGARVDALPGSAGDGSAGADGGPGAYDEFRVSLQGDDRAAIKDLGTIDFASVRVASPIGFDEQYVPVAVGHTYLVLSKSDGEPAIEAKFHVLDYRDNDAVLIEWAPLPPPLAVPQGLN